MGLGPWGVQRLLTQRKKCGEIFSLVNSSSGDGRPTFPMRHTRICQEVAFSCPGVSADPSAEVNNAAELCQPAALPQQPAGTAFVVIPAGLEGGAHKGRAENEQKVVYGFPQRPFSN